MSVNELHTVARYRRQYFAEQNVVNRGSNYNALIACRAVNVLFVKQKPFVNKQYSLI